MTAQSKKNPSKLHETILRALFILLSVASSFALVFYGISLLSGSDTGLHLSTFAYVTMAYGLGNIAILSLAWRSRPQHATTVYQLIALCYFGVFVIDTLRGGLESSTEIVGLLLLAAVLCSNGIAISKVVDRPNPAGAGH